MDAKTYSPAAVRAVAMMTAGHTVRLIQQDNPNVLVLQEVVMGGIEALLEDMGVADATADELRAANEELNDALNWDRPEQG